MNRALETMLAKYNCSTTDEYVRALREILQEIALLGLWRSKFFEHAAFYGGTALRILYGLDRFSEDLDFSLLHPDPNFSLDAYRTHLEQELAAFGFKVHVDMKNKAVKSAVQSAFLKANTANELLVIQADEDFIRPLPHKQTVKIKIEIDTNPPAGFDTEVHYLLNPVPFGVRVYSRPDLFAGKMHALLFRRWKNRVKGRDWYDFVWYLTHYPKLHLAHLEQRMRQSGDWQQPEPVTPDDIRLLYDQTVQAIDIEQARAEVEPFVHNRDALAIWSREFFLSLADRIEFV
ncbi:nucleotidyl transferase AbiEii/AbiGii toxin family protein [Desulfurispira natronophila]|uniref:Putative nucleotidyltransferase component of viral defense system n=1 Tax=Desulfurispira natronophila TaxID=682562 RepID=A0A7W7Y3G3_9BACT|nr:nucleotidyl transferase AbiEii/AbiGii toxin family protein [Desulfurispira natronophila]MBB5021358.1 putative nucleotidyltransferase component of viral defense system [Desulfurispira natronophila]